MRIAIIVTMFPPRWLAGTEIATYNIAKHLAERQYEVHVITSLDEGLPQNSIEEGFCIHRVRLPKVKLLGIATLWLKALLVLKRINPDIVHVQTTTMSIIGVLAKKLLRKPYVVWGRGSDIYTPWLFKNRISRLVLKNADAVIALTEDMKKEMQKTCDKDIYVIPNGVDFEKFWNLSKKDIRRKLGITNEQRIVISVGSLRPVKGIKYLIQAMSVLRQKNTKANLMLVGDGEERQNLEELVEELNLGDYITFAGEVPNEKIPEYMVASDVFALPSLSEGFGIVNLEAMASGLPAVVSNVSGLPEIIKDGENGFLVEPRNPLEIAKKIQLLLEDNKLRERISRNNKEKAKSYNWESVVEKLEKVYQAVKRRE